MTLKSIEPDTCNLLREAGSSAAGSQCEIFFMSHQDCFFQYILHQPEEMWTQNVLLYDYRKDGIHSYELQMNRNSRPVVCLIEEENFPQMKMTDVSQMSDAQKQAFFTQLDNAFLEIVRNHCEGKFVSSAFLLGDHFTRDWCKDSLRYLCKGRRVFQGNNLFSKGACYGAREKVLPSTLSTTYVYLSDECLHANIGMNCNRGKEETYQPLLNAGTNWYDARRLHKSDSCKRQYTGTYNYTSRRRTGENCQNYAGRTSCKRKQNEPDRTLNMHEKCRNGGN